MKQAVYSILHDEKKTRVYIFVGAIGLLFLVWVNRNVVSSSRQFGYLGVFLINFVTSATVLFPLPGVASVFVGGAIWNPVLVGITGGIGATLGELLGYLVGYGGSGFIRIPKRGKSWLRIIKQYFSKAGFVTTFVLAALPFPFFDVVGIVAGALTYPVWKFALATLLGRVARDILFAWSGQLILGN